MIKPKVYSYLRFSDPSQASGSSIDRQLAYTRSWAAQHGMALDESLTMRDEGLSAYHGKNVTKGALGAFLDAIDQGKIAHGSVLVVEGLDRLSRIEPILAQAQLAQIINAGITVVTVSDGKEYNRERLKAQPMDLIHSLLIMIRAHEESDTKSKRVKAAIRRLCVGWQAGTYRGIIRNGKDPKWVQWTGSVFELIPERADAMREAIRLFLDGHGAQYIFRHMKASGIDQDLLPQAASAYYKTLKSPCLIGTKTLAVDGEEFELRGYYPPLIDPTEYQRLQASNLQRIKRKGKGEIPGLITGIGLLHCGYCGRAVVAQNLMTRRRQEDGTPQDGHRRLICCGNSLASECDVAGSVSVVPIERALLAFCSDQFNLSSLHESGDPSIAARSRLSAIKTTISDFEKKLDRLTEAMLADTDSTPIAFIRKAREIEADLAEAKREETLAEANLSRASQRNTPAVAEQWHQLQSAALSLDYDSRMKVRQLVIETFERIVLYHQGITPRGNTSHIDMLLVARGGVSRFLRINRKTGEWVAHRDTIL